MTVRRAAIAAAIAAIAVAVVLVATSGHGKPRFDFKFATFCSTSGRSEVYGVRNCLRFGEPCKMSDERRYERARKTCIAITDSADRLTQEVVFIVPPPRRLTRSS
jgi:hypothetical protein